VITTKGWFELEPATSYTGLRMRVRRGNAIEERQLAGARPLRGGDGPPLRVRDGRQGAAHARREGLRDMKLIMAVYEAAKTGRTIKV
jgi:glucose-fructose oxidoreductase